MNFGTDNIQLQSEMTIVWHYLYMQKESPIQATVGPEHFVAAPVLGQIWERCLEMAKSGAPIDFLEACRGDGLFDAYEPISNHVVVTTRQTIEQTEQKVRNNVAVRRAALSAVDWLELVQSGEEDPETLHQKFSEIAASFQVGEDVKGEWHDTVARRVVERYLQPDTDRMIPMPVLGDRCRGWKFKKFYLVGGITSNHKTTFALNSAYTAADAGFSVLYWTLEDDAEDVCERVIVSQTKIMTLDDFEMGRPARGQGDASKMRDLVAVLEANDKLPIWYIDKRLALARMVAEICRLVAKHGIRMVIVDFMQLVPKQDARMSDTDHQTEVAQTFADLAKRLNIVMIAVVQLTQEATKRSEDGLAPRTGDIRGGSAIGQAAYGCVMTHKPTQPKTGGAPDGPQKLQLVVRKWKRAKKGSVDCWVDGPHDRIWVGGGDR